MRIAYSKATPDEIYDVNFCGMFLADQFAGYNTVLEQLSSIQAAKVPVIRMHIPDRSTLNQPRNVMPFIAW